MQKFDLRYTRSAIKKDAVRRPFLWRRGQPRTEIIFGLFPFVLRAGEILEGISLFYGHCE